MKEIIKWIILIWIISFIIVIWFKYISENYWTLTCIKSHKEQQIQIPMSYHIWNWISMPLWNWTIEEVEVCDEYKWIK